MNYLECKSSFGDFHDDFSSVIALDKPQIKKIPATQKVCRDLATYSEKERLKVYYRFDYIKWIHQRLKGGWTKKNLEPLIEAAEKEAFGPGPHPNWRTLALWWGRFNKSGFDILSLLPKDRKKGNHLARLAKPDEKYYELAVMRYLTPERPSIAGAHEYYKDVITVENEKRAKNKIEILSYTGFYKRIIKLPPYDVMLARYGKERADREFNPVGSMLPPTRILQRVEIDHSPLDLILLDDELHIPLGRPYLTVLIDCYSRCIVGFHFGFKEPSYYSVSKALVNAVMPKSHITARFPAIEKDWPCFGKFENLVVDNGAEFWSENLERVCQEIKINVQYNLAGEPWLKPLIERFYGVISSKLVAPIPGKTFSNILKREGYNPAKDAVMRFSTFNELIHKWIIDVYHFDTDARKIKMPPYKLWSQSFQKLPPLKMTDEDCSRFKVVLGYSDYRKPRKAGIHIHNLRYDSVPLAAYRKRYVKNKDKKLLVKTNPDDISHINVYLDELKEYLTVPCVDPIGYTKGLSLLQHQINVRLQKEYVSLEVDLVSLAKARIYIHNRIEQEASEIRSNSSKRKVKSISRLARHSNINSDEANSLIPTELPIIKINDEPQVKNSKALPSSDDWDDAVSNLEAF